MRTPYRGMAKETSSGSFDSAPKILVGDESCRRSAQDDRRLKDYRRIRNSETQRKHPSAHRSRHHVQLLALRPVRKVTIAKLT